MSGEAEASGRAEIEIVQFRYSHSYSFIGQFGCQLQLSMKNKWKEKEKKLLKAEPGCAPEAPVKVPNEMKWQKVSVNLNYTSAQHTLTFQ